MSDLKLTDEEVAHIRARRELAAEQEKERLKSQRAADLDDIKPGMSQADKDKVLASIRENWLR